MNEKESESVRQLTEIELKSIYYQDNLPALAVTCLAPASARVGPHSPLSGSGQALRRERRRPSFTRLTREAAQPLPPQSLSPEPSLAPPGPRPGFACQLPPSPPQQSQNLWPPAEPRGYGAGGGPPRLPGPLGGAAGRWPGRGLPRSSPRRAERNLKGGPLLFRVLPARWRAGAPGSGWPAQ